MEKRRDIARLFVDRRREVKRLFIACPVRAPTIMGELMSAYRRLCGLMPNAAELRFETNVHITLAFVGEVAISVPKEKAKVQALNQMLEIICGQISRVSLSLGELGTFPGVVWAGIGGTEENLYELHLLQTRVCHVVEACGFSIATLPFVPHLTIGRFDKALTEAVAETVRAFDFPPQIGFEVGAVELMESVRLPHIVHPETWVASYLTVGSPHLLGRGRRQDD